MSATYHISEDVKARHDKMVSLVERMLDLHKQLPKAKTDLEKTAIERQIAVTGSQIDQLMNELYGLTERKSGLPKETEVKDARMRDVPARAPDTGGRMKRRTISILGLLAVLLSISRSDAADLRITLRLADSTRYSAKYARTALRGDSAIILMRLDWLYDEPGFRPPSARAKVENRDNRITVSVSDTSGAARIEYLASTRGLVEFRLIATDSVAAAMLNRIDDWLRSHPRAATAGPDSLDSWISYRRYRYRVLERDYPLVSNALKAVDTAVLGDWRPAFGKLDTGKTDTSRALFFVERQAEISNARGQLFGSAVAHRYRGSRSPNAPQTANETEPFIVDIQLSHDTFCGYDPVRKLTEMTTSHVGQRIAIMLDTIVIVAPVIRSPIPDGSCMVTTGDTLGAFARDLTTIFRSGPLFAPLVVERVERVGGK